MTRGEFLKLGNYITCLSSRITTYDGNRLKIENSMFRYVRLFGSKCFIKSIKDESEGARVFDTVDEVKKYIQGFPVEGMMRI